MKNFIIIVLMLVALFLPGSAGAAYLIEVLQVSRLDVFEEAYQGILKGLEKNNLIPGNDIKINRTIIDTNPEAELYNWENLRVLMKVKILAGEIIERKPDLIITIGTPATKYSRFKIIKAGIPLVFTCVEVPEMVGCISKTQAGSGFTGVTIYTDPLDILQAARLGLPNMKKLGIIHSDDDYAVAYADEIKKTATGIGLEAVSKQVELWERITPAAEEMILQGVDTFFIPFDRYYRLKGSERSKAIAGISFEHKIPCISSMEDATRGSFLYAAHDFTLIGNLTADQAAQILTKGVKPETIPVARQDGLNILVDMEASKKLGIELPIQLLKTAIPDSKQLSDKKGS